MRRRWSGTVAAAAVALCVSAGSAAAGVDIETGAGFWSRDMRLPQDRGVAAAFISLGGGWAPSRDVAFDAEIFTAASRGDDDHARVELRKAFVTLGGSAASLRIGRQVDVWGRADRLNPSDALSPRDYTTLSTDDDDQRLGLTMARADVTLTDTARLSLYWIPEFRANRLLFPLPGESRARPDRWDASQFAAKLDSTGGAIDWSLSYYAGRDRVYDLALDSGALLVQYNRIRMISADVAASLGAFGYRAEIAFTDTEFDPNDNPLVRRPEIWGVAGIDRSFNGSTYINLQASFRRVLGAEKQIPDPVRAARRAIDALRFQQDELQLGVAATLRQSWDDRRWNAELVALHYLDREQGLLRAELRRQLSPAVTMRGRAQKFYGEAGSYFERISPASSVTVEMRAAF